MKKADYAQYPTENINDLRRGGPSRTIRAKVLDMNVDVKILADMSNDEISMENTIQQFAMKAYGNRYLHREGTRDVEISYEEAQAELRRMYLSHKVDVPFEDFNKYMKEMWRNMSTGDDSLTKDNSDVPSDSNEDTEDLKSIKKAEKKKLVKPRITMLIQTYMRL